MARVLILYASIEGQTERIAQQHTASFGGALLYSQYGLLKRLLLLAFVGLAGGDTDTSRNYAYTDWEAVDRFAAAFSLQTR